MTKPLRILVVESRRHAADDAVTELTAGGHTVVRCADPSDPSFPCAALQEDRACPLETKEPVDVVLAVRPHPRSQPAPGEIGVTCAARHHIPLVVAGSEVLNPFEPWTTEVVHGTVDVVSACERAARAPLARHSDVAARAIHDVMQSRNAAPNPVLVHVRRDRGRLVVRASSTYPVDQGTRSMASVRVIAALRVLDPHAAGIDVVFTRAHSDEEEPCPSQA